MTAIRHRPDQDILTDLVPLLVQAYEAGRWYPEPGNHNAQAEYPDWHHPADVERRITRLWAEARAAGLTPRRIASAARLPGRELYRWITDRQELVDAHNAEVHHLKRAWEEGLRNRALLARTLLQPLDPVEKLTQEEVAALFGVSRQTIVDWLKRLAASHDPTPVADAARAAEQ